MNLVEYLADVPPSAPHQVNRIFYIFYLHDNQRKSSLAPGYSEWIDPRRSSNKTSVFSL